MTTASIPAVAAFFDVDRTLIDTNSGQQWLAREWKTGQLSWRQALASLGWLAQYRLGWLDFQACAEASLARYRGRLTTELRAELESFTRDELIPKICREAREAIDFHRRQGHRIVLLTSGTDLTVAGLAQALDVSDVVCTELEIVNGRLTGRLVAPPCFGAGKVRRCLDFAQAQGIDLNASYFYSDSATDLPMFECIGFARVVNPDLRLAWLARRHGWPVAHWRTHSVI